MIRAAKIACAGISRSSLVRRYVHRIERRETAPSMRLRALTYHRIGNPQRDWSGDPRLFSATPEGFGSHLDLLAEHYHVVSMEQVLAAVRERQMLPPRAVLITFDDAYPDFQSVAWPMLQERGLPVTLFVPTAYPDRKGADFWWDRLARAVQKADPAETIDEPCGRFALSSLRRRHRVLKTLTAYAKTLPHDEAMAWVDRLCVQLRGPTPPRPATLGWDALRSLRDQGVSMGGHTRTHPLLTRVTGKRLEDEIAGCKQDIDSHLSGSLPVFAYPAGAVGSEAPSVVQAAGFELAWTTCPGVNWLGADDSFQLRRYHVGATTTASLLRARLAHAGTVSRHC